MKLRAYLVAGGLVAAIAGVGLFNYAHPKMTLFDAGKVTANLARMDEIFPSTTIAAASAPRRLPEALAPLPETLEVNGTQINLDDFLDQTRTTTLTVVRNGAVVGEIFRQGYDAQSRPTSFSVAKSFVATLAGVAIHKGWIGSVEDLVARYLPELEGSAWDGVTIAQVLEMSTGTGFTEDYNDRSTDAYRVFDEMFIFLKSIDDLAGGYRRASVPGSAFHYASINTHVLGMVLRRVSGRPLAALLEEELWEPMGATGDAYWLTDLHGTEIGFWGLAARPRDYARLGLLMLNDGVVDGQRILPQGWAELATTPDNPLIVPGAVRNDWGYKYQWWVPVSDGAKDYTAIGIWGQFIYVNPEHGIVIVKTSADPDFSAHEYPIVEMFRAMAAHYASQDPA